MEREDYFFGPEQDDASDKVYALVIYDITNDKKRRKFAKLLQGYGYRIQMSGFEINVSRSKFNRLIREIPRFCSEEDSIRVYKINSKSGVMKWEEDRSVEQEDVILI